jgi:hypothetical protein
VQPRYLLKRLSQHFDKRGIALCVGHQSDICKIPLVTIEDAHFGDLMVDAPVRLTFV